ncbi:MAG: ABC transporter substrate-binding protein [Kineosporiaceae bacterium]
MPSARTRTCSASLRLVLGLGAALAMASCAASTDGAATEPSGGPAEASGSETGYPVEIENCGRTLRFDAPPERAVLSYHPVAEMFVGLGLADRAVGRAGYSGAFGDAPPTLPEQEADFERIPVVSDTVYPPTREELLALRPDFLLAYGDFDYGGEQEGVEGLATLDQLADAGVQVYTVACPDPSGNYAGETLDAAYRSLTDLGRIFGVSERADQQVAEMQAQIESVQEQVSGRPPVDTIMYAGGTGPLLLSGGVGINDEILQAAGGRNLFPDDGLYFEASREAVAAQRAEAFVVFAEATDPDGELDPEPAASFLTEAFPEMPASADRRIAVTSYEFTAPGWRSAQTVEDLARQLHPDAFE